MHEPLSALGSDAPITFATPTLRIDIRRADARLADTARPAIEGSVRLAGRPVPAAPARAVAAQAAADPGGQGGQGGQGGPAWLAAAGTVVVENAHGQHHAVALGSGGSFTVPMLRGPRARLRVLLACGGYLTPWFTV